MADIQSDKPLPDQKRTPTGAIPAGTALVLAFAGLVFMAACYAGFRFDPPFSWPSIAEVTAAAGGYIEQASNAGALGVFVVVVLYALGVLVAAPSSLLTLTVTLIYGLWAVPIAWAGALVGLALAFWLARRGLSPHVRWFCDRYPVTRGMERALVRNGFWLVLLMRQSPVIPFTAQNYLFGMLGTPARGYLVGSALGILPGTIVKVMVFSGAQSAMVDDWGVLTWIAAIVATIATIAAMVIIGRSVRAELRDLSD